MRIKFTNGILVGIAILLISFDIELSLKITASIEAMTALYIFVAWLYRGYRPIEAGSFLASILYPNTHVDEEDLSYQEILLRVMLRVAMLGCLIYAPGLYVVWLAGFLLTLLYK